jgi:hypothetical protein
MSDLFTFWFHFENIAYMALVTISNIDKGSPMFLVQVTDESLYHILPFGLLALDKNGEFQTPHGMRHRSSYELVSNITSALSKYISVSQ